MKEYQPAHNACVELKNGRFADVVNGRYFNSGVRLILKDGKIAAMPGLPGEAGNIPLDFTVDLEGKTVMPGLFNTHSHIQLTLPSLLSGMKDIRLNRKYGERQIAKCMADCLTHGITTIRDAWTEDLRMNRTLKEKIASGEMPGPRIFQSVLISPLGGTFAPKRDFKDRVMFFLADMPFVDYEDVNSGVVAFPPEAGEQEVRDAINRAVDERGAEYIKFYDQREKRITYEPGARIMTFDQLQAAADQARCRGGGSTMHHLSVESFRRGVQAGVSSLVHIPYDTRLTEGDIEAFNKAGCVIEPTISFVYYLCWKMKGEPYSDHPNMNRLTQLRNQTYPALAEEYWVPELRQSFIRGIEKANQEKMRLMGFMDMSHIFKYYAGVIAQGVENIRLLFEQDVCIASANDAGAVPCSEAMIGHELELCELFLNAEPAEKRFRGADALRMATINSAKAMGREKLFGSITTGKIADLVIVDGNPFEDFRVVGSPVAALFMDGKLIINNCGLQVESVH